MRGDAAVNDAAFAKVRADKEREANNGHDGTWVAHPDLVPVAMQVFDRVMPTPNQLSKLREDVSITREQMLKVHDGERTEAGPAREHPGRRAVHRGPAASGRGAVPLYNLMEDAATAEICRTQIWQWVNQAAKLNDGRVVSPELFKALLDEEMAGLKQTLGAPF